MKEKDDSDDDNDDDVDDKQKGNDGWESCSDDDSDGEWIDVHHSSDEEVRSYCP